MKSDRYGNLLNSIISSEFVSLIEIKQTSLDEQVRGSHNCVGLHFVNQCYDGYKELLNSHQLLFMFNFVNLCDFIYIKTS